MRASLVLLAASLVACGSDPVRSFTESDSTPQADVIDDAADVAAPGDSSGYDVTPIPVRDGGTTPDMTVVYAHSDSTLYAMDPHTNALRTVGTFGFPSDGNHHAMTDIAIDADGDIIGVTVDAIYRINATSAACTLLSPLPGNHNFVGLTFLPVGVLDPAREVLVGGATDGSYWRIDPDTGTSTRLGQFQGTWGLSGDIVSVRDAATYATVRHSSGSGSTTDSLATIDPRTGSVRILGDTGFARIYGLGYWRGSLFGFTRDGSFISISATTGRGRMVSMPAMQFSGAGVTTVAPVAPL